MRILHLIASIDPKSGGPIEYAQVMAAEHAKANHTSIFVTLDPPDASFLADFSFEVHGSAPAQGFFSKARKFGAKVAEQCVHCDVAVIHGLWNPATIGGHMALSQTRLPWVIFTHGMLDPYFRKSKPAKHWVKQAFWTLWQGRVLSNSKAVLFTCEEERRLAKAAFLGHQMYPERVVAFCASDMAETTPDPTAFAKQVPNLGERDYLLYLSRIHPKKAVDQLIEAFAANADIDPELDLVIAGPDQIGWTRQLQSLADKLGIGNRVHWPGMVTGAAKAAAYKGARAFVLPSHQENFGLVVAEALSVGTPVLISDKVNIWREVEYAGAGLIEPDTLGGTTSLLTRFLQASPEDIQKLRSSSRPAYDTRFSVSQAAKDLISVLQDAK